MSFAHAINKMASRFGQEGIPSELFSHPRNPFKRAAVAVGTDESSGDSMATELLLFFFNPVYCVMPQRVPVAHVVSGNESLISFETNSMPAMQWSQPARSQVENGAVFEPCVRTTCRYDHNFPGKFPWQQSRQIFIRL